MQTATTAAADLDLTTVEGVSSALAEMAVNGQFRQIDDLLDDLLDGPIDADAVFEALTFMPVSDLAALVDAAPYSPLAVALVERLVWAEDEIARMDAEWRETKGLPRKQPGKVVDLRTRRTLN